MSEFIAITYEGELTAQEVRLELLKMQKEHLIDLEDAVVAIRKPNGKVKLHQMVNLPLTGAIGGGFWGALIGLIFLNPLLGAAIGGVVGATAAALTDVGINDKFMKELASNMSPGSSTLFVLIREVTADKVLEEVGPYGGKILRTSLTHEDENKLQAVLSEANKVSV